VSSSQAVLAKPVHVNGAGLKCVRIALAGCGTVGGELVRLVHERRRSIEERHGLRFEFTRILVRDVMRPRRASIPDGLLTTDIDSFIRSDADMIVEAVGGFEPARQIATAALESGRTFVTANKALLAAHGPELVSLARMRGGRVLYEASVAGGVPVIRVLRDALAETGVRVIRGILNGTTNYILTSMSEGAAFAAALDEARALGYAEADPSRDLDGRDAADKVAVLAWLAFGTDPRSLRIARRGILPDPDRLVADAQSVGGVMRLVGECVRTNAGVVAAVEPVVLPPASMLARTCGPDNAIEIETEHNGTIQLAGPGAGGAATASALLSDMINSAQAFNAAGQATRALTDARAFSWLISAPASDRGELALQRVLRASGINYGCAPEDGGVARIITEPCSRARVACVERDLASIGRVAIIARYEMARSFSPTPDVVYVG